MDFSLSDEQLLLRDTVRQFMEAEIRPKIREYERQEKFPAEGKLKPSFDGELMPSGRIVLRRKFGAPPLDPSRDS